MGSPLGLHPAERARISWKDPVPPTTGFEYLAGPDDAVVPNGANDQHGQDEDGQGQKQDGNALGVATIDSESKDHRHQSHVACPVLVSEQKQGGGQQPTGQHMLAPIVHPAHPERTIPCGKY